MCYLCARGENPVSFDFIASSNQSVWSEVCVCMCVRAFNFIELQNECQVVAEVKLVVLICKINFVGLFYVETVCRIVHIDSLHSANAHGMFVCEQVREQ